MADCCVCKRKIPMFSGFNLASTDANAKNSGAASTWLCDECIQHRNNLSTQGEKAKIAIKYFEDLLPSCENAFAKNYIEGFINRNRTEVTRRILQKEQEQEQEEAIRKKNEFIKQLRYMPVTTADLHVPYEIIGPIIFNTTNRGVFTSAFMDLYYAYQKEPLKSLLVKPNLESPTKENGFFDGVLLLSLFDTSLQYEGRVGQSKFDSAFYISVAEMKLRAADMGADAIIGFKMDFDLDTTNIGSFYIQAYGTAVKMKSVTKDGI